MALRHEIPADTIAAQRKAADPAATAWVSANAGSGKTHVLTQRVLRLLLQGVPPSRILCLTFTKAAAANMSMRVFDTLSSWTALEDGDLEAEIRKTGAQVGPGDLVFARRLFARTVETPGGLKIQTIHAFCERLLHLFPFEANVASHFRVIEDDEQDELLAAAREQTLARALDEEDGPLGRALQLISGLTSADDFSTLMKDVLGKRDHLGRTLDRFGGDLGRYEQALRKTLEITTNRRVAERDAAQVDEGLPRARWLDDAARLERGTVADRKMGANLRSATALSGDASKRAYLGLFFTTKQEPRKRLITGGLEKEDPSLGDELRDELERLIALREILKAASCLERSMALVRLAAEILHRYTILKNYRALLDFDDLITKTRLLLSQASAAWVLYKLDSGIDHILVDEAQDTSPGQWEILQALADEFMAGEGHRNLRRTFFAVGDEKQSIYSFQGAEPRKFEEMRKHFQTRARDAALSFENVSLNLSFRSAAGILTCVDAIFTEAGNRRGLTYGDDVRPVHAPLKHDLPSVVEIWPLVAGRDTTRERDWLLPLDLQDEHDPPVVLAQRIAAMIAGWLRPGSPDRVSDEQGRGRAIRAGDVMILVRRRSAFFEAMIRALKEHGVPVAGADRLQLLQNIAVMDLIAAGRAALLPEDDLSLACVLKSPLIGLDDDDLIRIAPERTGSLYAALAGANDARCQRAFGQFERWRARAREAGAFGFFSHLLGAEGGRRAMQRRLGPEARDAMDEFLKLALDHSRREAPSLQQFLHELEDVSVKRDMEAAGQSVRVLTVHASKGLEAKIVILPDTCSAPGSRFDPKIFELADASGPSQASPLLAWSPRAEADCGPLRDLRARTRAEAGEEYRRLLYVATTRAEERLYVMGYHGTRGPDQDCWYDMIHRSLAPLMHEMPTPWDGQEQLWRIVQGAPLQDALQATVAAATPPDAPAWLNRPALAEAAPLPPLRPSSVLAAADQPGASDPSQGLRAHGAQAGRLMHEILQHATHGAPQECERLVNQFIARRGAGLPEALRDALARQALAVMAHPSLAPLFGQKSRAEVALAGQIEVMGRNIPIIGRIDRLAETDTGVIIADFKTGAPPKGDMPASYTLQLALYRAAVARLYPDRTVRALLVWTDGPQVIELDEASAAEALEGLG